MGRISRFLIGASWVCTLALAVPIQARVVKMKIVPGVTYPAPPVLPQVGMDPQASVPPSPDGDPVKELEQIHREEQKTAAELNAANPLSDLKGATAPPAGIQKLLALPAVQNYVRFLAAPEFRGALESIAQSPSRTTFLYLEGGWLFLMIILRFWLRARRKTWYGRLFVSLGSAALLSFGGFFVIPALVFGDPYVKIMQGVVGVITAGW